MNEIQYDTIIRQYNSILKSVQIIKYLTTFYTKFSKYFLEIFSKLIDDPKFCNQALSSTRDKLSYNKSFEIELLSKLKTPTHNPWYEIYLSICKKQRSINLPTIAFNYCFDKAKDLYIQMKNLSKTKKIKFTNILRTIYKEISQVEKPTKTNFWKKQNPPIEEKISLRNFLKQKTVKSLGLSHSSSLNSNINITQKVRNKILKETEEEKKEEKEKHKSSYINKINKLNIYVGQYESLVSNHTVVKTKIYDGSLCTTYLIKKEIENNLSEGFKMKKGNEKVKGLLSDGKTIFIANDSRNNKETSFRSPIVKFSSKLGMDLPNLIKSITKAENSNFNSNSNAFPYLNKSSNLYLMKKSDTKEISQNRKNSSLLYVKNIGRENSNSLLIKGRDYKLPAKNLKENSNFTLDHPQSLGFHSEFNHFTKSASKINKGKNYLSDDTKLVKEIKGLNFNNQLK